MDHRTEGPTPFLRAEPTRGECGVWGRPTHPAKLGKPPTRVLHRAGLCGGTPEPSPLLGRGPALNLRDWGAKRPPDDWLPPSRLQQPGRRGLWGWTHPPPQFHLGLGARPGLVAYRALVAGPGWGLGTEAGPRAEREATQEPACPPRSEVAAGRPDSADEACDDVTGSPAGTATRDLAGHEGP
ncbi:hypothetical protein NDU88_002803 [Pleurodeles waltl]|uniref:Uncharacterized protein n=1 Tax=Pleurodeles waltl TaxID=8319 RepID=A0AAV7RGR3_PLEWA|nr:hypothetical protein NDU88_002803 [Pleurodeles waltl]